MRRTRPQHRADRDDVRPAEPHPALPIAASLGNQQFTRLVAAMDGGPGVLATSAAAPTVAREPTGTVETSRGTEEIEGSTVRGGTGDYFDNVRHTMTGVSTRVAVNGAAYGVQVLNACESFKTYANGKIEDLDGEITGEELAEALVGAALSAVGGQLTGRIANAAFKFVAEQVQDLVEDKVKEAAKSAASNDDDEEALKQSIDGITQGARDASTQTGVRAQGAIDGRLRPIFERCQQRESLDDAENALVGPFWGIDPTGMDREIERMFGLPGPAAAAVAQVEVFNSLVREFERLYDIKTASLRTSIYVNTMEAQEGMDSRDSWRGRAQTLGVGWQQLADAGRTYRQAQALGIEVPSQAEYDRRREEAGHY